MIARMRAVRRDHGNPPAALAIIASIFAIAFAIKLLPAPTRQAQLPMTEERALPSRAIQIWGAVQESARSVAAGAPTVPVREVTVRVVSTESTAEPTTTTVLLTFDVDPGEAPLLRVTPSMALALPMAVDAVHAETESSDSPLVLPFTKTRSALRVAFVKTGSAIKAAASGTAGVFVSNP